MPPALERLFALEVFGIKLGVRNIAALCETLGHPERAFASVHVAGTNGKGSVTAMVHQALMAAGVKAARYTSPHLSDLRERFVIEHASVDTDRLIAAAERVLAAAADLQRHGVLDAPPTFFEATTAIAFDLFRAAAVEVAVIEVGLGGRFDATNVITPRVSAITSIGLDHQAQLGNTLAEIAFEKAGIIKDGVPVVVGPVAPEAEAVIARVARERNAPLVPAAEGVERQARFEDGRAVLRLRTPQHDYGERRLGLLGAHQLDNALVAVRTLEMLHDERRLTADAIGRGISDASWPGRLEWVPLENGSHLLLDAAHNPDGASALADHLARWHPERPALVFAAMRDKDAASMLQRLLPHVGAVFVTSPDTPRATAPETLASVVRELQSTHVVEAVASPVGAVRAALATTSTVCVAGSIFLVGEVRAAVEARAILP